METTGIIGVMGIIWGIVYSCYIGIMEKKNGNYYLGLRV